VPLDRPTFVTTRLRTGYDVEQVDLAVAMILENLALPTPRIGPADLTDLQFSTVSYRLGYDIEQVEDWLDDVRDELARRSGTTAPTSPEAAVTPPTPAPSAYAPVTRSEAIVEVESSSSRWLIGVGLLVVLTVVLYLIYA
jgi:DivIVA domain-containing protein